MPGMKITLVSEYYYPNLMGGAELQVKRRAESFAKMGIDVRVISFDSDRGTVKETINGVRITRYKISTHKAKILSLAVPVARALRRHEDETDVYHIYNAHPLPGTGLYKMMGGRKPILANLDNYSGFCPISTAMYGNCNVACRFSCLRKSADNPLNKFLALPYASVFGSLRSLSRRGADRYIAPSDHVRQEYIRYGFDAGRIVVVPHSIDLSKVSNGSKVVHGGINILYVGRMSSEKGVDLLIRAFHQVSKDFENMNLILVGGGPFLESYHALAQELGISDKVIFTGYLDYVETERYFGMADIFVHPAPFNEPFNVTLLEAMGHEVPLVVSDVSSLKQIVKDAGITAAKGDVSDLALKLSVLVEDQSKIAAMRERCKAVVSEYSDERILKKLVEMYHELK